MALFAEVGYDGLSMRQLADRLGVQAGSLYYHVQNKSELLRLMADRVAQGAYDAGTAALAELPASAGWQDRVAAQVTALRRSIRKHPGGAVLLAGSPTLLSPGALSVMERLLQSLQDGGVRPGHSGVAADTLLSYVTGFVLQEQSDSPAPQITAEQGAAITERFPLTVANASAHDEEEMFDRSIRLICLAVSAELG